MQGDPVSLFGTNFSQREGSKMTKGEIISANAANCFGIPQDCATFVEAEAGTLLGAMAEAERKAYARRTGQRSYDRAKKHKPKKYEALVLAILRDGMSTAEVRAAINENDPDAEVPGNLSQALKDMRSRGLLVRSSDDRRAAVWGPAA